MFREDYLRLWEGKKALGVLRISPCKLNILSIGKGRSLAEGGVLVFTLWVSHKASVCLFRAVVITLRVAVE